MAMNATHQSFNAVETAQQRVDVYPSQGGYTATISRDRRHSAPLVTHGGEPKRWRNLDTLMAHIARNIGNPSITLHLGVNQ